MLDWGLYIEITEATSHVAIKKGPQLCSPQLLYRSYKL